MSQTTDSLKAAQKLGNASPRRSTLAFLRQFARCYHFEKEIGCPAMADMVLN